MAKKQSSKPAVKSNTVRDMKADATKSITQILIDCGLDPDQAEREAENASRSITCKQAGKVGKKSMYEQFNDALNADEANIKTYFDVFLLILKYTPGCRYYEIDLPFSYRWNNTKQAFKHSAIDDFQYCCSALCASKNKRHYVTEDSQLNYDYAPDVEFSKQFKAQLDDVIHGAVVNRFIDIYREMLGPNGLGFKDMDFVVKNYGFNPMHDTDCE